MKRALASPLLSLVMPGLGQILNRQVGKGAALVTGVSVLFLITLGLFVHKLSKAAMAMGEIPEGADKFALLHEKLVAEGFVWVLVLAAVYLAVLAWAVVDAWRAGRALDAAGGGGG